MIRTSPAGNTSTEPFVIFALPRCRTAWLSRFLSYGDWACGHEEARHCRSVEDIKSWLSQPFTGTAETAAAPHWRVLRKLRPNARVVVVRRPVEEVAASLMARSPFDRPALMALLRRTDAKLAQIARRWPGALEVSFADLASEVTCKRVWEHCLPYPFDRTWWETVSAVNIQINLPAMMRHWIAHQPQIDKLSRILKEQTLAELEQRQRPDLDGFTLAAEPFATFYPAAQKAFRAHLAATDQLPDPGLKNIDLLQRLDDIGALQCVTARCNGRIFGYLMTVIGPSTDGSDILSGIHIPFYADPTVPGLGMRLQRFARDQLKERGVTEIIMRAGVRGSGPRLGTLYRRLGAEDLGQLYRLNLET